MANSRAAAQLDQNFRPSLFAVSSSDPAVVVVLEADPTTNRLLVSTSSASEAQTGDASTGTDYGIPVLVIRDDALSTLADAEGDFVNLRVNSTGALHVTGGGGGTEYNEDDATPNPIVGTATLIERDDALTTVTPVEGDWIGLRGTAEGALWTQDFNSDAILSDTSSMVTDLAAIETLLTGIDVDTDAIKTAVEVIDNAISGTEMQVDVVAALPAGTNAIGKLAANSGVDIGDVDVTSIAAGTNAIGNVGIIPRTSGGWTIFRSIDLDESEEEVKATAGQVGPILAFNTTAAPLYLKFYNATAATVEVGTTAPVMTMVVPGNADSDGSGFTSVTDAGWEFTTAITVACTTGVADNDTGAPGGNACIVNIGYK